MSHMKSLPKDFELKDQFGLHAAEMSYSSDKCSSEFAESSELKYHLRQDSKQKCFTCK